MNPLVRARPLLGLSGVCCVLALAVFVARAQDASSIAAAARPDGLWLGWADAEGLELAAVVDRLGDDAVLARLDPSALSVPTYARLAAIRGTPFMRAPELALPWLATLAAGRDPELAPVAARRAYVIAQALAHEGLARRELLPSSLTAARAALLRAAGTTRPRADIRFWLEQAAQLLGALGVP